MKRLLLFVCGVVATLLFVACSSDDGTIAKENSPKEDNNGKKGKTDDEVIIRMAWWGDQPRHDYTQEVINMYMEQHSNVKIEPEFASWDDYWQRLAPQAAANELPDIMQMDLSYISRYALNEQLTDLNQFIGNEIDVSNIADTIVSGGTVGDGIYGFNTGVNAVGFQYNPVTLKSIGYDEIPENWTWDDYIEIGNKAAEEGIYFDTGMQPDVFFNYYLRSKGKRLYAEDGSGLGYDDDQLFIEYFGMMQERIEMGATPRPDDLDQNIGIEDSPVVTGQAIGVWQWSNQFVGLQSVADDDLIMAPMPGPNAADGLFLKPSMFFAIAENSDHKEIAASVINFFMNDVEANKLIDGDRGVPGSSVIKDVLREGLTESQAKVFDYIEYAEKNSTPMGAPDPSEAGEIIDLLDRIAEEIAYNQSTPEEAAEKFRAEAEKIFAN